MRTFTTILCVAGLGMASVAIAADTENTADDRIRDNSTQRIVNPERTPTTTIDDTSGNDSQDHTDQAPAGTSSRDETGSTSNPRQAR